MKSSRVLPIAGLILGAMTSISAGQVNLAPADQTRTMTIGPDGVMRCATPEPARELNSAFATKLYQQLRTADGNVFFSPFSITAAMGMVYMGSDGNTATEISNSIGFNSNKEFFAEQINRLQSTLIERTNKGKNQLRIANALCITGAEPEDSYQKIIREKFDAEIFDGDAAKINAWVKKKTEGNIDKILDKLYANSACVLLNAVYFKGTWKEPFDAGDTHEQMFRVSAEQSVKAQMMSRRGSYVAIQNDPWTAVEMPYEGDATSMILIMPSKTDGMMDFDTKIDEMLLNQVCEQLHAKRQNPGEIRLVMPKFKIATSYDLMEPIKKLGISDAFGSKADFTAMYAKGDAYISQIKHKATLEVNELGSEASAVTAIEIALESAIIEQPVTEIRFDRPFIVLIRENETRSNLFMGRISDPTK